MSLILKYFSDDARVRAQKAFEKLFRLHDLVTEEVSFVDRAANKRKFLIAKGQGGFQMNEKIKQALTRKLTSMMERLSSVIGAVKGAAAKADKPLPAAVGVALKNLGLEMDTVADTEKDVVSDSREATAKALTEDLEISEDVKTNALEMLGETRDKFSDVLTAVKEAKADEKAEGVSMDLKDGFKALGSLLVSVTEKYPSPGAENAPAAKSDSKISPERKEKVMSGLRLLGEVLDDASADIQKNNGAFEAQVGMRSPTDGNKPNVGAGHQPDLASITSARELMSAVPGLSGVLKEYAQDTLKDVLAEHKKDKDKLESDLKESQDKVEDLAKQVGEQTKTLKRLGATVRVSNGGGPPREDVKKSDNIVWPSDMNDI